MSYLKKVVSGMSILSHDINKILTSINTYGTRSAPPIFPDEIGSPPNLGEVSVSNVADHEVKTNRICARRVSESDQLKFGVCNQTCVRVGRNSEEM